MSSNKNFSSTLSDLTQPWKDAPNAIWLATSLKLYRNMNNFHFPGKLATDGRKQVLDLIQTALASTDQLQSPVFTAAEQASPLTKEYIYEHFLSMHGFHQAHAGEAFVTDQSHTFLGIMNIRDHLQLQVIDTTEEIEKGWNRLLAIENSIGHSLRFAFTDSLGFLTANPALCGTGLVISGFLQLPALIHTGTLPQILTKHKIDGVESTGLQGDADQLIGDILVLYNSFTLGLTEEDIATAIRSSITKLYIEEKSARSKIQEEGNDHIKDTVSRGYGLLLHSYQIETAEALGAISLCKLGLDLGWIKGIDNKELNQLFMNCRRGHLLADQKQTPTPDEVLRLRSEMIHKSLQNTELTI